MATEYVQFAAALVFFAGMLVGSYWFVYVPRGERGNPGSSGAVNAGSSGAVNAEGNAGGGSGSSAGDGSADGSGDGPGNTSAPRVVRDDER